METLLVSFSVFFLPPTPAMLNHSSWLPPLGPGPDLRGPGGFWRGCPPGPGHECHLEDGNGIMELRVMKKHLQSRRVEHQWVLEIQFVAWLDRWHVGWVVWWMKSNYRLARWVPVCKFRHTWHDIWLLAWLATWLLAGLAGWRLSWLAG